MRVGASDNQQSAVATAAVMSMSSMSPAPSAPASVTSTLVWIAFALGLASAIPGLVLGLFGLPLGVGASAVSAVALSRLTRNPPDQRRGELLTLLSLGIGVFQIVFALVAFLSVNLA